MQVPTHFCFCLLSQYRFRARSHSKLNKQIKQIRNEGIKLCPRRDRWFGPSYHYQWLVTDVVPFSVCDAKQIKHVVLFVF